MSWEDILAQPGLAWLGLAALLAIIELLIPGIFLVFIAAGAAVTGAIALLVPLPLVVEIAIFALASAASVAIGRRWYARNPVESSDPLLNDRVARLIGQVVTVAEPIVAGQGRVRVGDSEWTARGADAPAGAHVRITGANGNTLEVEPAG
ncbi:NfeD family protein [Sphingomonas sp. LB-2]|uniref:NfeD family protein n=1 Tax=Sphingomonas caeni TaxID=2984949 RepID=UPI0022312550|nr:NfeD family protein [Sphingomonas caeni]MCW3848733.1 NfeD family protein [Sphingomonas caeni]